MKRILVAIVLIVIIMLVTSTTILAVQFLNKEYISLTFETNGGETLEVKKFPTKEHIIISQLPTPTKKGYEFNGWYLDASRTKPYIPFETVITADTVLYADYVLIDCVISFVTHNNVTIEDITIKYNHILGYEPRLFQIGSEFDGWYLEPTLNNRFDLFTTPITSNITLYAKWSNSPSTINFIVDRTIYTTLNGYYNTSFVLPQNPTIPNYRFDGWYLDSGFNYPYTETKFLEKTLNVYAKFTKINRVEFYLYNMSTDQFDLIQSDYVGFNEEIPHCEVTNIPTGYLINCWYTDPQLTNKLTSWLMPNAQVQLYASFKSIGEY